MDQLPLHILSQILAHVDQTTRVLCRHICSAFKDASDDPAAWPDMKVHGEDGFRLMSVYRPSKLTLYRVPATFVGVLDSVQHLEVPELYPSLKGHFPNLTSLKLGKFTAFPANMYPLKLNCLEVNALSARGMRRLFRALPSTVTTLRIDGQFRNNISILSKIPSTVETLDIFNVELLDIFFQRSGCRSLRALNVFGHEALLTIRFTDIIIQEWSAWVCRNALNIPSTALVELHGVD